MADPDAKPPGYGYCPVCHRTIRLKKDGTLRPHGREKDTGNRCCAGTGKNPA